MPLTFDEFLPKKQNILSFDEFLPKQKTGLSFDEFLPPIKTSLDTALKPLSVPIGELTDFASKIPGQIPQAAQAAVQTLPQVRPIKPIVEGAQRITDISADPAQLGQDITDIPRKIGTVVEGAYKVGKLADAFAVATAQEINPLINREQKKQYWENVAKVGEEAPLDEVSAIASGMILIYGSVKAMQSVPELYSAVQKWGSNKIRMFKVKERALVAQSDDQILENFKNLPDSMKGEAAKRNVRLRRILKRFGPTKEPFVQPGKPTPIVTPAPAPAPAPEPVPIQKPVPKPEIGKPIKPIVAKPAEGIESLTEQAKKFKTPEEFIKSIRQPKAGGKFFGDDKVRQYMQKKGLEATEKPIDIVRIQKPVSIKDVQGETHNLKPGEEYRAIELSNNQYLIQDGDRFITTKGKAEDLEKQGILLGEQKGFGKEFEGLEETVKGGLDRIGLYDEAENEAKEYLSRKLGSVPEVIDNLFDKWRDTNYSDTYRQKIDDYLEDYGGKTLNEYAKIGEADTLRSEVKFSQYQLPGGENYREILVKPKIDANKVKRRKELSTIDRERALSKQEQSEYDLLRKETETMFKGVHFGEGELSHLRMNDRTTSKGEDVAFIEELQSDWAMAGRKKGFAKEFTIPEDEYKNIVRQANKTIEKNDFLGFDTRFEARDAIVRHNDWEERWNIEDRKDIEIINKFRDAKLQKLQSEKGVPSHPLLKNWQELTLKRALRDAVESDAKYLSWISGDQTADRYDLSKQARSVEWHKLSDGNYNIGAVEKDSGIERNLALNVKPEKLESYVGKDLAQKILNEPKEIFNGSYKGDDLKIGGEWAINLYDKQIPSILEKMTKKYGGKIVDVQLAKDSIFEKDFKPIRLNNGRWQMQDNEGSTWGSYPSKESLVRDFNKEHKISKMEQKALLITPEIKAWVESQAIQPIAGGKKHGDYTDKELTEIWEKAHKPEIKPVEKPIEKPVETKIVNKENKPLLLYHGSNQKFDKFDVEKGISKTSGKFEGFHFGTIEQAKMRNAKNIIPVYLEANKLLKVKDKGGNWNKIIKRAKSQGFDGIKYLNRFEGIPLSDYDNARERGINVSIESLDKMSDIEFKKQIPSAEFSYIVFSPNQIKTKLQPEKIVDKPKTEIPLKFKKDIADIKNILTKDIKRVLDKSFEGFATGLVTPKTEVLTIIDKYEAGKPLTEIQTKNLLETIRNKRENDLKIALDVRDLQLKGRGQELSETELEIGDKFKIKGEEFEVTKKTELPFGNKITIEDGLTYELGDFETIMVDKGSFVKKQVKAKEKLIEVQAKITSKPLKTKVDQDEELLKGLKPEKIEKQQADLFDEKIDIKLFGDEAGHIALPIDEIIAVSDKVIDSIDKSIETIAISADPIIAAPEDFQKLYKNEWVGNKDVANHHAKVISNNLSKETKRIAEENKLNSDMLDAAIHINIDTKADPSSIEKYKDKLNFQWKKIVKLSQNLPPEALRLVTKYEEIYKRIGERAKKTGVIRNLIEDGYAARIWEKDQKGISYFTGRAKFAVKTRHAKTRVFKTIIEGLSKGYKLKVKSASGNLSEYTQNVNNVMFDKQFLKAGMKIKNAEGDPLFTTKQLEGYNEIRHPNFKQWKWTGEVEAPDKPVRGRNFFIASDGAILEAKSVYAPENIATIMNNVLGKSVLREIPITRDIMRINEIMKGWVLQGTMFHHQAFTRSYLLGGKIKGYKNLNPHTAMLKGLESIDHLNPMLDVLIKNGMTLGVRQDFESISKGLVGKFQEKWLRMLFDRLGTGLKSHTAINELEAQIKEHPGVNVDKLAERVAELLNNDFGGLNLKRMARNPTFQDIMRFFVLAADWTESNFRTIPQALPAHHIPKMLKIAKEEGWTRAGEHGKEVWKDGEVARRFWWRVVFRGFLALETLNLMITRKHIWQNDKGHKLEVDVTPIARKFGYEGKERLYFPLLGHMLDPRKMVTRPDKFILHKSSFFVNKALTEFFNEDWAGRPFLPLREARKRGTFVGNRFDDAREWGYWRTVPTRTAYQIASLMPVGLQAVFEYMRGQISGFETFAQLSGTRLRTAWIQSKSSLKREYRRKRREIVEDYEGTDRTERLDKLKVWLKKRLEEIKEE